MRLLSWVFLVVGGLQLIAVPAMLIWARMQVSASGPAYHDTYLVTVSLGWPTLLYLAVALSLIGLGVWLRLKSKGV